MYLIVDNRWGGVRPVMAGSARHYRRPSPVTAGRPRRYGGLFYIFMLQESGGQTPGGQTPGGQTPGGQTPPLPNPTTSRCPLRAR